VGIRLLVALAILLGGGLSVAHAEEKPWAVGVSKDQQKQALALYTEGNGYFEQDLYPEALKRFEAALVVWDHPAIRYNAALSSMHLDRIEHAFEHLTLALRFGAAPFTPEIYKEAVNYERLLGGQLGEIEVTTQQPVEVTLDGKPLLGGPGSATQRVRVGTHQLVATRPGYLTDTRTIDVKPRAKAAVAIELKKPAVARKLVRRWPQWKPYAVVIAGGMFAAGAGLPLYLYTRSKYRDFDDAITAFDATHPPGTPAEREQLVLEDKADGWRAATVSVFVVSGVVVATGIALVVMNQPRPGPPTTTITPQIGSDRAGLVISGRW
jgi:tetratricopeptide (TPR) repeat protein